MNFVIYFFIAVGIYFTYKSFKRWFSKEYEIPSYFFLNWKFLIYVAGMLFIATGVFYAEYPLNDIGIFAALILGLIIGLINATISTAKRKSLQNQ